MSREFAGRVALVTGAAGDIGRAIAATLAAGGARVAASDLAGTSLPSSLTALALSCDVGDAQAVEALVAAVEDRLGPIDHLAHAAGVLRVADTVDLAEDDWDHCMRVNARGTFLVTRAVARRMVERRRGSIVVIGSNAATAPRAGMAAYAASKAAVHQQVRCLALELAPLGIRCNLVSPGSTDTAMQRAFASTDADRERILRGDPARFRLGVPVGRIARPEDVAESVAFLLSDRARHIVLHDLRVDGGATLDM
jgi:2,3-dihydro-2,3-dihydroxybenzoate dehydrogenase